jgi:hypothetical protein
MFAALVGAAGLLAPLASTAQTAPEKSTCLFYENVDYKGKHFGLYKGDALITKASVKPESVYKGGFKGRVFTQPEWAGKVSSVKVPKGCSLSLVVESGQSFQGVNQDIPAFAKKYNDQGVGFGCTCSK